MKFRIVLLLLVAVLLSSCAQYSCPTYGNSYVYTPTKKKAFKFSKPIRRAEQ